MKLCPCSYAGHPTKVCTCAEGEIQRYRSRLSGPLMDRIDLHLSLTPVSLRELGADSAAEPSASVRHRVEAARGRQRERYASDDRVACNAQASGRMLMATLSADAKQLLGSAAESLALSARAYHRVIKVARTIADLALHRDIEVGHLAEALRYRR